MGYWVIGYQAIGYWVIRDQVIRDQETEMGIGGCRLAIGGQKIFFELREAAARFPLPEPDLIWSELQSLKHKFFTGGDLDLDSLTDLEQRFESSRRIDESHYLRRTLYHLQKDYDVNGNLTPEARERLLDWENFGSNESVGDTSRKSR